MTVSTLIAYMQINASMAVFGVKYCKVHDCKEAGECLAVKTRTRELQVYGHPESNHNFGLRERRRVRSSGSRRTKKKEKDSKVLMFQAGNTSTRCNMHQEPKTQAKRRRPISQKIAPLNSSQMKLAALCRTAPPLPTFCDHHHHHHLAITPFIDRIEAK